MPMYALLFTPSGQQGPAAGWFVFQLAAVFAIIYFLILRPQKKQQERHRQLLASLQRGDKVLTSGGILGEVVHLKDDEVTVKSGEARLIVARSDIANILNRSAEAKPQRPSRSSTPSARPRRGGLSLDSRHLW